MCCMASRLTSFMCAPKSPSYSSAFGVYLPTKNILGKFAPVIKPMNCSWVSKPILQSNILLLCFSITVVPCIEQDQFKDASSRKRLIINYLSLLVYNIMRVQSKDVLDQDQNRLGSFDIIAGSRSLFSLVESKPKSKCMVFH